MIVNSRFFSYRGKTLCLLLLAAWLINPPGQAVAQVSIAPTALFMNDQSPFANVIVSNGTDSPQEITVEFRFGYSVGDEEGNISIHYDSTGNEASFVDYLTAFPRNFILQPGNRQTVRMVARNYRDKEDGTYWSRVSILASPVNPPVETQTADNVAARINFNFEQVIPAFFKRGDVHTGLNVENIDFRQDEEEGRFIFDLQRTGNSPFLGSVDVSIRDREGNEMLTGRYNISVYFNMRRGVELNLEELGKGEYTAEFTFRSDRRDISSANLIEIEPIQISKQFAVE